MSYTNIAAIRLESDAYEIYMKEVRPVILAYGSKIPDSVYDLNGGSDHVEVWDDLDSSSPVMSALHLLCERLDILHEEGEDDLNGYKFVRIGEAETDIEVSTNDCRVELDVVRTVRIGGVYK